MTLYMLSVESSNKKEVNRTLYPYHATKIPRMKEALQALGKDMIIGLKNRTA